MWFHSKKDSFGRDLVGLIAGEEAQRQATGEGNQDGANTPQQTEQNDIVNNRLGHVIRPENETQEELRADTNNQTKKNHKVVSHRSLFPKIVGSCFVEKDNTRNRMQDPENI